MNAIVKNIIDNVINYLNKYHKFPESIGLSKKEYIAYIAERKITGRITFEYDGDVYELPRCKKCY